MLFQSPGQSECLINTEYRRDYEKVNELFRSGLCKSELQLFQKFLSDNKYCGFQPHNFNAATRQMLAIETSDESVIDRVLGNVTTSSVSFSGAVFLARAVLYEYFSSFQHEEMDHYNTDYDGSKGGAKQRNLRKHELWDMYKSLSFSLSLRSANLVIDIEDPKTSIESDGLYYIGSLLPGLDLPCPIFPLETLNVSPFSAESGNISVNHSALTFYDILPREAVFLFSTCFGKFSPTAFSKIYAFMNDIFDLFPTKSLNSCYLQDLQLILLRQTRPLTAKSFIPTLSRSNNSTTCSRAPYFPADMLQASLDLLSPIAASPLFMPNIVTSDVFVNRRFARNVFFVSNATTSQQTARACLLYLLFLLLLDILSVRNGLQSLTAEYQRDTVILSEIEQALFLTGSIQSRLIELCLDLTRRYPVTLLHCGSDCIRVLYSLAKITQLYPIQRMLATPLSTLYSASEHIFKNYEQENNSLSNYNNVNHNDNTMKRARYNPSITNPMDSSFAHLFMAPEFVNALVLNPSIPLSALIAQNPTPLVVLRAAVNPITESLIVGSLAFENRRENSDHSTTPYWTSQTSKIVAALQNSPDFDHYFANFTDPGIRSSENDTTNIASPIPTGLDGAQVWELTSSQVIDQCLLSLVSIGCLPKKELCPLLDLSFLSWNLSNPLYCPNIITDRTNNGRVEHVNQKNEQNPSISNTIDGKINYLSDIMRYMCSNSPIVEHATDFALHCCVIAAKNPLKSVETSHQVPLKPLTLCLPPAQYLHNAALQSQTPIGRIQGDKNIIKYGQSVTNEDETPYGSLKSILESSAFQSFFTPCSLQVVTVRRHMFIQHLLSMFYLNYSTTGNDETEPNLSVDHRYLLRTHTILSMMWDSLCFNSKTPCLRTVPLWNLVMCPFQQQHSTMFLEHQQTKPRKVYFANYLTEIILENLLRNCTSFSKFTPMTNSVNQPGSGSGQSLRLQHATRLIQKLTATATNISLNATITAPCVDLNLYTLINNRLVSIRSANAIFSRQTFMSTNLTDECFKQLAIYLPRTYFLSSISPKLQTHLQAASVMVINASVNMSNMISSGNILNSNTTMVGASIVQVITAKMIKMAKIHRSRSVSVDGTRRNDQLDKLLLNQLNQVVLQVMVDKQSDMTCSNYHNITTSALNSLLVDPQSPSNIAKYWLQEINWNKI